MLTDTYWIACLVKLKQLFTVNNLKKKGKQMKEEEDNS